MKLKVIIFSLCILVLFSCKKGDSDTQKNQTEVKKELIIKVPEFNSDSAFYLVDKQVKFGKRVPNSLPHAQCAVFLENYLKKYCQEVTIQAFEAKAFDGKMLKLKNIVASINPNANKRLLFAAHWDTRPFSDQESKQELKTKPIDGANDGGSGVAILLELARVLALDTNKPQNVGIDIILFDGEDYGQPDFINTTQQEDTWCLGSQYWSKNKHKANYQAYFGILLDMVGAPNAKFAMDGTSKRFAPEVQKSIWNTANKIGYGQYFVYQFSEEIIDDHLYVNKDAQIPMVDIIEYEPSDGSYFSKTWHTQEDNINNIDKKTLKAVGQTLLQVIYQE